MSKTLSKVIIYCFIAATLLSWTGLFYEYAILHNYQIYTDPQVETTDEARGLISSNALMCDWAEAPLLFVSENVFSPLIYYSHVFPAFGALILIFFVWRSRERILLNKIFIALSGTFILWCAFDLILWASENHDLIMVFWSAQIYLDVLIYFFAAYLLYVYINENDLPDWAKFSALIAFLPIILLAPSTLNLVAFDYTNCDREAIEGPLWYYAYFVEFCVILISVLYVMRKLFLIKLSERRKQVALLASGIIFFLFAFSLGNIVGSLTEDWTIAQYGLFGMPIFLASITYLIVRYKAFRIKMIAANALIISLWVLLFSILLLRSIESARPVIVVTLILFGIIGFLLTQSVKKEILQREEIEKLAKDLAHANARLRELDKQKSEFVSIASHQLRSPLTSIRGYASMLVEGSFGKVPPKVAEILDRIQESSAYMALSIEDFLNVSRIEQGRMKYENAYVDIKTMVERVVDEIRPTALKKGLVLLFHSECTSKAIACADPGKTRQIIYNLIDNSLKYTPKGSVDVTVRDDMAFKKIYVSIKDTGVGIDEEGMKEVFEKFVRAKNANEVNVSGSGLGLYVAKQMAEAMQGKITVASEGLKKGSTFTLELPLVE